MANAKSNQIDIDAIEEMEKKYDTALNTREHSSFLSRVLFYVAILFACYHIYTAGFGTPVEHVHMGIHLTGLFILIFASFPLIRNKSAMQLQANSWYKFGNVPLYDWIFIVLGVCAALFLTASWTGLSIFGLDIPEQALRQGNPTTTLMLF